MTKSETSTYTAPYVETRITCSNYVFIFIDSKEDSDFLKQASYHLAKVNSVLLRMIEFWSDVTVALDSMTKKNDKAERWRTRITKGDKQKQRFMEEMDKIEDVGFILIVKLCV